MSIDEDVERELAATADWKRQADKTVRDIGPPDGWINEKALVKRLAARAKGKKHDRQNRSPA
ncbi:MAG: hypothetical protein AAFR68_08300 [Pseudomonadota bacterium]